MLLRVASMVNTLKVGCAWYHQLDLETGQVADFARNAVLANFCYA